MTSIDTIVSPRVFHPKPNIQHSKLRPICNFTRKQLKTSKFSPQIHTHTFLIRKLATISCNLSSSVDDNVSSKDFVTKVLKENPSQVEPKFLIGKRFYTLKEKENMNKSSDVGIGESIKKKLNWRERLKRESEIFSQNENVAEQESVYLRDILREYKGKLYVPEQIFGKELSEEEEFDRNLEELPKIDFEEFMRAVKSDKVKLLTSKEVGSITNVIGHRDFVVDLKEIPGDKSLHRTKWAMSLNEDEVQTLLEEYHGPQCEIERQTTVICSFL